MRFEVAAVALLGAAMLAGCVDDSGSQDVGDVGPALDALVTPYKGLPERITGLKLLSETGSDVTTGSGIWIDGHYAYVGARNDGLFILDIIDPAKPVLAAHLPEIGEGDDAIPLYSRDVDLVKQANRTLAITAGQSQGLHIVDVTNASAPEYLTTIMGNEADADPAPVHNVAVPPGQSQYVYNSRSTGEGGAIDVVDVSDPENPFIVTKFGSHGCHDIMFLDLPDKKRAYCAGVQATQIYDIADPVKPTMLGQVDWTMGPHIGTTIAGQRHTGLHHLAMSNQDGTLLIIGDEWQGGGTPGGCFAYQNTVAAQLSTPMGALTFYDITDEANPKLLSWISPPTMDVNPNPAAPASSFPSCTSHFGRLIEDRPQLVMSWYTAGVLIIDFSDPSHPFIVNQIKLPGTSVWDAQVYQGYVFTGDIGRGLDVLEFI